MTKMSKNLPRTDRICQRISNSAGKYHQNGCNLIGYQNWGRGAFEVEHFCFLKWKLRLINVTLID
jgi:hypothetical protein